LHRKSIDEQNEQSYRETIQRNVSIIHGQNRKYDNRASKRVSSLAKTFADEPLIEMSHETESFAETYMTYGKTYGKSYSRKTNTNQNSNRNSNQYSTKPNMNYANSPLPPIQIKTNLGNLSSAPTAENTASSSKSVDHKKKSEETKSNNDSELDFPRMRMSVIPVDPNLLAKKIAAPVEPSVPKFDEQEEEQTEAACTV